MNGTEVRFLDQSRGLVLSFLPPFIKVIDIFKLREMSYGEEILFQIGLSRPVAVYMFLSEEESEARKLVKKHHGMRPALKELLIKYQCDLWIKPYKYSIVIPLPWVKIEGAVFEDLEVIRFNGMPLRKQKS